MEGLWHYLPARATHAAVAVDVVDEEARGALAGHRLEGGGVEEVGELADRLSSGTVDTHASPKTFSQ